VVHVVAMIHRLTEIGEGLLVALLFVLPMFIVFPLTTSHAVLAITLALSFAGLGLYLWKRTAT